MKMYSLGIFSSIEELEEKGYIRREPSEGFRKVGPKLYLHKGYKIEAKKHEGLFELFVDLDRKPKFSRPEGEFSEWEDISGRRWGDGYPFIIIDSLLPEVVRFAIDELEVAEMGGNENGSQVFSSPQEYFDYLEVSRRGSRRLQKKLGGEENGRVF